jgi:hypothetical protein
MFKKIFKKRLSLIVFFAIIISFTVFFAYRYYTTGFKTLQDIEHNTAILNQNQIEIEELLESNSRQFQNFEENLKKPDFEASLKNIQELEKNKAKIENSKINTINLKNKLKKTQDIVDSKIVFDNANLVLDSRGTFLSKFLLVQETQVCNLEKITKASQAINLINKLNLEAKDKDEIDMDILNIIIQNFETVSSQIGTVKDCFNEINQKHKTEEFLKVLQTDVDFFKNQSELFKQVKDGISEGNVEKLEQALTKLEQLETKNQIGIFTNQAYLSAFQDIFQEVVVENDKLSTQQLDEYKFLTTKLKSKYWFIF